MAGDSDQAQIPPIRTRAEWEALLPEDPVNREMFPAMIALLEAGGDQPEAARQRAPHDRSGRRTTITIPDDLDASLIEIARQVDLPRNQVLVVLARYGVLRVDQEFRRALELARRRELVWGLFPGEPGSGEFPTDEEMDEAMREVRELR